MKRRLQVALVGLAVAGAALFLVTRYVARPSIVFGDSMAPTLQPWDFCLLAPMTAYAPRRGDIVMFRTADDPPLYFVKRVIALPGETIAIEAGIVNINGAVFPEPYTTPHPAWQRAPTLVPADKVYVIGDNRALGDDAVHGLVATRLIKARMIAHWRWKQ